MQLYACDTLPNFCPYCGHAIKWADYWSKQDFYSQCSHTCLHCHAKYVHIPAAMIVKTAADMGSDIAQYVKV